MYLGWRQRRRTSEGRVTQTSCDLTSTPGTSEHQAASMVRQDRTQRLKSSEVRITRARREEEQHSDALACRATHIHRDRPQRCRTPVHRLLWMCNDTQNGTSERKGSRVSRDLHQSFHETLLSRGTVRHSRATERRVKHMDHDRWIHFSSDKRGMRRGKHDLRRYRASECRATPASGEMDQRPSVSERVVRHMRRDRLQQFSLSDQRAQKVKHGSNQRSGTSKHQRARIICESEHRTLERQGR